MTVEMATPPFGLISEYDPEKEWAQYAVQYVKRLDYFFTANGIEEAVTKRDIFLTMLGPTTFKLLLSLVAPTKPGSKPTRNSWTRKEHHSPALSEVVQCLQFYTCDYQAGESISTFVAELRSLTTY